MQRLDLDIGPLQGDPSRSDGDSLRGRALGSRAAERATNRSGSTSTLIVPVVALCPDHKRATGQFRAAPSPNVRGGGGTCKCDPGTGTAAARRGGRGGLARRGPRFGPRCARGGGGMATPLPRPRGAPACQVWGRGGGCALCPEEPRVTPAAVWKHPSIWAGQRAIFAVPINYSNACAK